MARDFEECELTASIESAETERQPKDIRPAIQGSQITGSTGAVVHPQDESENSLGNVYDRTLTRPGSCSPTMMITYSASASANRRRLYRLRHDLGKFATWTDTKLVDL